MKETAEEWFARLLTKFEKDKDFQIEGLVLILEERIVALKRHERNHNNITPAEKIN